MKRGRVWFMVVVLALLGAAIATAQSRTPEGYSVMLRSVEAADLGVTHPVGLSYSPRSGVFMAIGRSGTSAGGTEIAAFDPFENRVGTNAPASVLNAPLNATFLATNESLLAMDGAGRQWVELGVGPRGLTAAPDQTVDRFDASWLRLANPQGVAVDEAGNRLFVLDAAGPNLVTVQANLANVFGSLATGHGHVERTRLDMPAGAAVRGLAYNPANGHLYIGDAAGTTLRELSTDGRLLMEYDLSEMGLIDPQGMVFAPSADATDDPAVMNLFIADSGGDVNLGQIVEISFVQPPSRVTINQATATLVNIIDASKAAWNPSAPDTAGIAYRPAVGRLIISDSEVEEAHPDFQGYNVFQSTTTGFLDQTGLCSTQAFSNEPTGTAVNPANGNIFFSDDNNNRIYEVNLVDGIYCNGNDTVAQLNTLTFNSDDPEGLAVGNNRIFISDGINMEVYIVNMGLNGAIGGNDDFLESNFDTQSVGLRDPEGIEYSPVTDTLFVVSTMGSDRFLLELTTTGAIVNDFDLSFLGSMPRSGLALAPGSQNPSDENVYLASRGVDNGTDPNENDGKVYELYVGRSSGPPPPTSTPTVTPTFGPSPTPTPGPSVLTFDAIEDAKVEQANPAVNYGALTLLEVDGSPVRHFLVKFQVSGLTGPVTNARLRLYSIGTAVAGGNVHGVANTWDETTVTWSDAPAAGTQLGSYGGVVPNTWYEVNLAGYVTGDGTYSFRIQPTTNDGAEYRSSEGGATTMPQLIVEFNNLVTPTDTPTPTETGTPTDTPTITATPTDTGTPTNTPTPTDTATPTDTPTITATPTDTGTPTNTPTPTDTATPTDTPTFTATPTDTSTPTITATPTDTSTPTVTVTPTGTSTPTSTPTPTNTPPPVGPFYLSLMNSGPTTVGNLSAVNEEDIILLSNGSWSMVFDGSDVGVTGELDAFHFLDADSILFSLGGSAVLPGAGSVQDEDIVRFDATSLGDNTAGTLSLYFDGSDVGLNASDEDIDALDVLPDGRIIISTTGNFSVTGASGADEDLFAFTPATLGGVTTGTWAIYFDGSDVSLTTSGEDIDAAGVAGNGAIYLSTTGNFAVTGVSGADEDVFVCTPTSLGTITACTFGPSLAFDGSAWGLSGDDVDGFELP